MLFRMSNKKIAVVVGSNSSQSLNRKVAEALVKLFPSGNQFNFVPIGDLPLYSQDQDANPPKSVVEFREAISSSDAVIFVTPEYNRSIPGVLKNAIDHGSRPYGKSVWAGKPAGVLGASPGAIGSGIAQQHLRPILAYLDMPTLNQPEVYLQVKEGTFNEDGSFNEGTAKFLQNWVDAFLAFIK